MCFYCRGIFGQDNFVQRKITQLRGTLQIQQKPQLLNLQRQTSVDGDVLTTKVVPFQNTFVLNLSCIVSHWRLFPSGQKYLLPQDWSNGILLQFVFQVFQRAEKCL